MHVEKNIPVPRIGAGAPRKYPFGSMEIGDSVFIPGQTTQGNAANAARQRARIYGEKFVARCEEGGVRIWRTA